MKTDKVHTALSEWAETFGAEYRREEPFKLTLLERRQTAAIFRIVYRVTAGTEDGVEHVFQVDRVARYCRLVVLGVDWTVRWAQDGKEAASATPPTVKDVLELFHDFTLVMETDWPV